MANEGYRWRDFPFGSAGPLALAQCAAMSFTGVLSLVFVRAQLQLWLGIAVAIASWGSLFLIRQSFARRRNLHAHTNAYVLGTISGRATQNLQIAAALLSVIVPRALGWPYGAVWALYGLATYAIELYRLHKWRAVGYRGAATSGWARDDRRTGGDLAA